MSSPVSATSELDNIVEQANEINNMIDKRLSDPTKPVNHLKVGDTVYQLVADHAAVKEIARLTGVHPYADGNLTRVLNQPDGLEICLYAMLVKPGPKHQLPREQRNLSRRRIAEWFEEAEDQFGFWQQAGDAVYMTFLQDSRPKKKPEPVEDVADSADPQKHQ